MKGLLGFPLNREPPGTFHGARVTLAANLVNGFGVDIVFDTEKFDTDGFFDFSEPTRLTVPTGLDGIYWIGAGTEIGDVGVTVALEIKRIGDPDNIFGGKGTEGSSSPAWVSASGIIDAKAGDIFTVHSIPAVTLSGGNLTYFSIFYLGRIDVSL